MRGRKKTQRQKQSSGIEDVKEAIQDSRGSCLESINDSEALANRSRESVGKLLRRASNHRSLASEKLNHADKAECRTETENKPNSSQGTKGDVSEAEACGKEMEGNSSRQEKVEGRSVPCNVSENVEDDFDADWEDGFVPTLDPTKSRQFTIEIDDNQTVDTRRKPVRRASASEKELAELVHKVHLLCLLARGRLVDSACNDPLIQAALLSLLPTQLLKISHVEKLIAGSLNPLVSWFHNNFHVRSQSSAESSFHSALARALETREGTPEEIAALSVALLRALNLTTRFVSILNVASLKPDMEISKSNGEDTSRSNKGIFTSSTLMVSGPKQNHSTPNKLSSREKEQDIFQNSESDSCKNNESNSKGKKTRSRDVLPDESTSTTQSDYSESDKNPHGSKRKGDIEFEMQLEMALSSSAVGTKEREPNISDLENASLESSPPFKRIKRLVMQESATSSHGISIAVGSSKVGSPLYWAEVYCKGENLSGKWVHVDAVNMIVNEEHKVEAAAAACKTSLRYVLAFSGRGAKDVTRRYCMKWYKIDSQRVNTLWWDSVLAPMRILEEISTEEDKMKASEEGNNNKNAHVASRSDLEDLELETRALTEPLPTNQQAYKNHKLYAIEKWLTKYQILHPRGPILGFCSGHPVYPRTCVQTLKTKERWMRDGLQVKPNELPAKDLARPMKNQQKGQDLEADDYEQSDSRGIIRLYGKWQTEPLNLPHAVNGIVPKNDRGQVEVWSEKCLPPGTVHIRLPKVFSVAKRLQIDYASAMVGFEFRNGQSYPVFDGIVVCSEFKDAILEAYAEEGERRKAEEKRRNENEAISRWYQLLSSILTRQRLNSRYGEIQDANEDDKEKEQAIVNKSQVGDRKSFGLQKGGEKKEEDDSDVRLDAQSSSFVRGAEEDHKHVFLIEDQSVDEETLVLTKRCRCGFSVQVEEL